MNDAVLLQALMDDILKALRVNIITGELQPIKVLTVEKRRGFFKAKHIDAYMQTEVDEGSIHELDQQQYLQITSLKNIQRKVKENHRKLSHNFRKKVDGTYQWITFEMMIPKDYDNDNPWVLYLWKKSDGDACELTEALRMQSLSYDIILKVNITTDSFETIKMDARSGRTTDNYNGSFSDWATWYATDDHVHEGDVSMLSAFLELRRLQDIFSESVAPLHTIYRRKTEETYRWVMLELLPGMTYKTTNKVVMLYVHSVPETFEQEMVYHKYLEYHAKFDGLTGVKSMQSYQLYCQRFLNYLEKPALMAVYADINDLKELNRIGGYEQGNDYLKRFSRMLMEFFGTMNVFRIGGDRFVVLMADVNQDKAKQMFTDFYNIMKKQAHPMAALGFAWHENPITVETLVSVAERQMLLDKENLKKFN